MTMKITSIEVNGVIYKATKISTSRKIVCLKRCFSYDKAVREVKRLGLDGAKIVDEGNVFAIYVFRATGI